MTQHIMTALADSDNLVVEFTYQDAKGKKTRRVASPIRMLGRDRFLALCLSREEPRQFYLSRCSQMQVKQACEYLMPVAL